jgi:lipopolysaccharide/colanic/teichoic acid biosynthesis glycosyltransferase
MAVIKKFTKLNEIFMKQTRFKTILSLIPLAFFGLFLLCLILLLIYAVINIFSGLEPFYVYSMLTMIIFGLWSVWSMVYLKKNKKLDFGSSHNNSSKEL